jgi:hypothetical protein
MPVLPGGVEVTFAGSLRMREFRAMSAADGAGDYQAVYPFLAKIVKAWTLKAEDGTPLDPAAPASYDELDLDQYKAIVIASVRFLHGLDQGEV